MGYILYVVCLQHAHFWWHDCNLNNHKVLAAAPASVLRKYFSALYHAKQMLETGTAQWGNGLGKSEGKTLKQKSAGKAHRASDFH